MTDTSKFSRDAKFGKISRDLMPFLSFPPNWEVKMLWPSAGAAARFIVRKGDITVSVCADYDGSIGYYGAPFWEIYPYGYGGGDKWRGDLSDGDGLIKTISEAIGQQEAERT